MSRRAPAAADTAERNRAALKTLTKLDSNKMCADCKRNKHPRWASWNLGVFVCIRCSGIHRSLGVHISRVKSIDLDSWTDEQLASMVKWGNKRANRYWEHKLAEGHVPNDGKIESFIRTKYDSRRWAMDGPVPSDPASLDGEDEAGDDDVPLKVVQERARASSGTQGQQQQQQRNRVGPLPQPPRARAQEVDLFGDSVESSPARPSTTEPAMQRPGPPKAPAAAPKQTKPGESLLGLDFFGGTQSAPPQRPSSTGPTTPGVPGRTDLKQSILSLYASKPAAPPQPQATSNVDMFGGMQSPPLTSPGQQHQPSAQAFGGMSDAFGSLSFNSAPAPKATAFSGLTSPTAHQRQPSMPKSNPLSGGSFFDPKPAPPPKQTTSPSVPAPRKESFGNDFGDFSSAIASPPIATKSPPLPAPNGGGAGGMGDLFDLASPSGPTPPPKSTAMSPPPLQASKFQSAFNLSQPTAAPAPKPAAPASSQTSAMGDFGALSNMDAWGSNDAWATPETQPAAPSAQESMGMGGFTAKAAPAAPMQTQQMKMESAFDSGWGDTEPSTASKAAPPPPTTTGTSSSGFSVQQDEEFGGWSHASPVATTSGPKQGGMGGNADDLFGNVWE